MTTKNFLLLVLLPMIVQTHNSIRLDIWNSADNETLIHASGVARNIINDGDMCIFGITEDALRSGIRAISGVIPDNVFLRDPTGNFAHQFAINNWPQANTILGVESYQMIHTWKTTRVLKIFDVINEVGIPTRITGNYTLSGFDMVKNYWSRNSSQETGQSIKYDLNLQNGKTRMNYESDWGRTSLYTQKKVIVTKYNKTVDPDQIMTVSAIAVDGFGEARVTYQAGLDGNVIGHFSRGHNGRNFWPFDVNSAVRMGQISPRFRVVENIQYYYIADLYIEIFFRDSRREVHPCDIYDLEDNLIFNPTPEDIAKAKEIKIEMY